MAPRGEVDSPGRRSTAATGQAIAHPAEEILGAAGYRKLRDVLRDRENFDLDAYRPAYLARRLRARLGSRGDADAAGYANEVEADASERRRLLETLGVNVTDFFRDTVVWLRLEEEDLPPLVERREAVHRPIRVASLGCAGGQEAYSLAMVLSELTIGSPVQFSVDAFDIDPAALEAASAGVFAESAVEKLSEQARGRYFEKTAAGAWQVRPGLRSHVHVKRHDILRGPLPARYDVVLCRNVMIYMETAAKEGLFDRIHDALAPDGLLVIGQSEVIMGSVAERFRAVSPRCRIYRKVIPREA